MHTKFGSTSFFFGDAFFMRSDVTGFFRALNNYYEDERKSIKEEKSFL